MNAAFTLSLEDGSIEIDRCATRIDSGLTKAVAMEGLAAFYNGGVDHENGYEWIYLDGLSFGGKPSAMSLCFFRNGLSEVHWSANLPDAQLEEGWPTQASIDREIAFVRRELARLSGKPSFSGHQKFGWGELWSTFDRKGGLATSGLRYKASSP